MDKKEYILERINGNFTYKFLDKYQSFNDKMTSENKKKNVYVEMYGDDFIVKRGEKIKVTIEKVGIELGEEI
jgi:hypothetical protein